MKKKILCLAFEPFSGGGTIAQFSILDSLNTDKFEIKFWFLKEQGDLHQEFSGNFDINFFVPKGKSLKKNGLTIFLKALSLAKEVDLIFALQEGSVMYLGSLIGTFSKKSVVGWIHVIWPEVLKLQYSRWHYFSSKFFYKRINHIITVSNHAESQLKSFLKNTNNVIQTIPNMINTERIAAKSKEPLPEWANKIFQKKTIIAAGELIPLKQFNVLIEGFSRFINSGFDANLIILGEGPERKNLEILIKQLKLDGKAFMPGFQKNPYPFYQRSSVFCSCSQSEGYGLVLIEALYFNLPLIASNIPASNEILENGKLGMLFKPGDFSDLAKKIIAYFVSDFRINEKLNIESLKRFEKKQIVAQFENILSSI